jgi:hypothetical protein
MCMFLKMFFLREDNIVLSCNYQVPNVNLTRMFSTSTSGKYRIIDENVFNNYCFNIEHNCINGQHCYERRPNERRAHCGLS